MSSPTVPTNDAKLPQRGPAVANRLFIVGLLLAGFALRLNQLGGESLWYDETVSAYLATQQIPDLIAHTARDIHPPAYYLLLRAWQRISQPSVAFGLEFLYAWPSLWLSLVVMALTFAIAKRCFGERAAPWALAFAAVHPTQFWFAQEVRMYALGAACLLLTLWSVSPLLRARQFELREDDRLPLVTRLLYPLSALLGLYTLYYFLFWLAALNIGILVRLFRRSRPLRGWLLLQLVVAIGWLPWMPIFLRQATNPPVPTWRIGWQSTSEVLQAISEAMAALWNAHTLPLEATWPWALLIFGCAITFYVYAKYTRQMRIIWLILAFGPIVLLFAVSLVGPPIYHVRYIATYAPVFVILVAAFVTTQARLVGAATSVVLLTLSTLSIRQLQTDPRFAADDHRAAVASLAQQWRPGDAILVNAGWVYTAIDTYWPSELDTPDATRPPAIAAQVRLAPAQVNTLPDSPDAPILARTGSVDGEPSLGWGLPESDFFAITSRDTVMALEALAQQHARIWHYRLYDTVSDPNGLIRHWLADHAELIQSTPVQGRDYLRLEAYRTAKTPTPRTEKPVRVHVPDAQLDLIGASTPTASPAGEILYVDLLWGTDAPDAASQVALSLRLLDSRGLVISQQDTGLTPARGQTVLQSLALPVPADTLPGQYSLGLIVYDPNTLAPYTLTLADGTHIDSLLDLGNVAIDAPRTTPHVGSIIASFDYIDLVQSRLGSDPVSPGTTIPLEMTWRPRPSTYRDHYRARITLIDAQSQVSELGEYDLGAPGYPSSQWAAGFPLRQREVISLPAPLAPGDYTMQLAVVRAADGQTIPAHRPWHLRTDDTLEIGTLHIQPPE